MTSDEFASLVNGDITPWNPTGNLSDMWSDSTKEQYFNLLSAEQANELELDRWRLNNEYNTPAKQMERMIEAGINPAAAYQSVNSGNASSPADVHQSGTAAFHDTSDKLARVNTIMSSIASIMKTIESGVGAVQGIQDVQFGYQNNWYDALRAKMASDNRLIPATSEYWISTDPNFFPKNVEVAPGLYMEAGIAEMFPELRQAFNFQGGQYHISQGNLANQTDLTNRRTCIPIKTFENALN